MSRVQDDLSRRIWIDIVVCHMNVFFIFDITWILINYDIFHDHHRYALCSDII